MPPESRSSTPSTKYIRQLDVELACGSEARQGRRLGS
ncbi:hypothetical protein ACP70R_025550 [Stipagrostis hirtigluma subsp. patula]